MDRIRFSKLDIQDILVEKMNNFTLTLTHEKERE